MVMRVTFNPTERITPLEEPNEGDRCRLKIHKREHYITDDDNCTSVEPVNVTSCSGNCESSAIAWYGSDRYDPDCSCCKPIGYLEVEINFKCANDVEKVGMYSVITKCQCSPYNCVAGPSHEGEIAVNEDKEIIEQRKKRRRQALSRLFALPP